MIKLYRLFTIVFFPFLIIWILIRVIKGKEDLKRIKERFGFASCKRLDGKYIWLHGASVGESLVAINLANSLKKIYPEYNFLITSGTITSAKILSSRISPDSNIIHQFIPIDDYFSARRFFKFWKPDLGILIESEIWPNLLDIGSSYSKLILANAIISQKSFSKWIKYKNFAHEVFNNFSIILCQSLDAKDRYSKLYDKDVKYIGNLKFSSPAPNVDIDSLNVLKMALKKNLVLLAASTHDGDEEIIADIHKSLKSKYPNLITLIAPRHIHRSKDISKMIISKNLSYITRSSGEKEFENIDIYLCDSLGELGLFYSLANVSFIGGSFSNGGHNILEAAFFDTNIIVGPDMSNSLELTNEFLAEKAILQASDKEDLMHKIDVCLQKPDNKIMFSKARSLLIKNNDLIEDYIKIIKHYL